MNKCLTHSERKFTQSCPMNGLHRIDRERIHRIDRELSSKVPWSHLSDIQKR